MVLYKKFESNSILALFILGFIILHINFSFAEHIIKTSTGTTNYNVNEDIVFVYNFSVNNTDISENANITQVNISLYGNFQFIAISNGTNSLSTFSNTSSVLSFENASRLINANETKYFWFNASASTPGNYNFTITTKNSTGTFSSNISVTVNDTTFPTLSIVNPLNNTNSSNTGLDINYTYNELNPNQCWYNNGSGLTNTTLASCGINITGVSWANGWYNVTIYINDSAGNVNSSTISFRIDNIGPNIDFVSPTRDNNSIIISNAGTIIVNLTASDSLTGLGTIITKIYNSTALVNSTSSSSSPLYYEFSGLSSGTYYVNATVNDTSGNTNSTLTRMFILATNSFEFNGTTKDIYGNNLNNSLINLTISASGDSGPPRTIGYMSTTTNASGWFNLTLPVNSQWMYKPVIRHFNSTTNAIDYVGSLTPEFPYAEFSEIESVNFYLKEAGTINITAINSSSARINFNYMVKDTRLGYPIDYNFDSYVNQAVVYVPKDRNYSISIYPQESMPVSYNWNNFSSNSSYNIGTISRYNASTSTIHKQFNTSMTLNRYTGYVTKTGISGWESFVIVPLLLEPGDMIFLEHAALPYNMSAWYDGQSDVYNLTSGFYNITLPGSSEDLNVLLFLVLKNGSYYGSFKNITLPYSPVINQYNFTNTQISGLLGENSSLTTNNPITWASLNISCKKQTFNLVNSTNYSITYPSHVEVTLDYSSYGAKEFTFMFDTTQLSSSFLVPLLNVTGIKEMNIYSSMYSPKRLSKTVSQIVSNNNITLTTFDPEAIDTNLQNNAIFVSIYTSNSTCDIPGNEDSCLLGSSADLDSFNPLGAIISGGKISFRMGITSAGVFVHYVNVDLLASGPPDALFENNSGLNEASGNSFANAAKFGSKGPTIYDYVLVSMPYREGNSSVAGLNESKDVNLTIQTFYGQDENGEMDWNNPIWSSLNGSNVTLLAANYSHYAGNINEWQTLMNNNNCTRTASQLSSTNPCYIDTVNNRIWIRIPHFSGSEPTINGHATSVTTSSQTTSSSSQNEGSSANVFLLSLEEVETGITRQLLPYDKLRFSLGKDTHYVTLKSFNSNEATIIISSTPQTVTLKVGEDKMFDLNNDDEYDLNVKLNFILGGKASITIKGVSIKKEITKESKEKADIPTPQNRENIDNKNLKEDTQQQPAVLNESKTRLTFFIILFIFVVVIILFLIKLLFLKKFKKRR